MELEGAVEGFEDLAAYTELRVPGLLLLLLFAEKLRGEPGRDDRPEMTPLGRPRLEHARAGRRELGDVCGGACLKRPDPKIKAKPCINYRIRSPA